MKREVLSKKKEGKNGKRRKGKTKNGEKKNAYIDTKRDKKGTMLRKR